MPLYWRPDLIPGDRLEGPSIIAEDETSTFVGKRFRAWVAANHNLVIDRKQEHAT